ncbi:Hypothetical predicted protein [Olea europaea subsp. europaea]|uniref:Uncharacterized protein n=1 Tax=Olea europaea subsp. europaea TaxID=158383 RepID=A0A8S0ULQ2_OLEEU|nr:Hypothetical predicted protein [Olea europaea subsp. europaea]
MSLGNKLRFQISQEDGKTHAGGTGFRCGSAGSDIFPEVVYVSNRCRHLTAGRNFATSRSGRVGRRYAATARPPISFRTAAAAADDWLTFWRRLWSESYTAKIIHAENLVDCTIRELCYAVLLAYNTTHDGPNPTASRSHPIHPISTMHARLYRPTMDIALHGLAQQSGCVGGWMEKTMQDDVLMIQSTIMATHNMARVVSQMDGVALILCSSGQSSYNQGISQAAATQFSLYICLSGITGLLNLFESKRESGKIKLHFCSSQSYSYHGVTLSVAVFTSWSYKRNIPVFDAVRTAFLSFPGYPRGSRSRCRVLYSSRSEETGIQMVESGNFTTQLRSDEETRMNGRASYARRDRHNRGSGGTGRG